MEISDQLKKDLEQFIIDKPTLVLSDGKSLDKVNIHWGEIFVKYPTLGDKRIIELARLAYAVDQLQYSYASKELWVIEYYDIVTNEARILPGCKYQITFESKGAARKSLSQKINKDVAKQLINSGHIQIKQYKLIPDEENV